MRQYPGVEHIRVGDHQPGRVADTRPSPTGGIPIVN